MLHGKGIGNWNSTSQSWMTKSYEETRQKAMEDKSKYTDKELKIYEISGAQGGGMTNHEKFEVKQFPFPTDPSIRKKETIDIRKVDPKISD